MSYAEDILKLRSRIADAVTAGVIDKGGKDTVEAILIQIMNDAEKNRQNCVAQAEQLRKQASTFDGQAAAFASTVSIVYKVINGYVQIAERNKEEEARLAAEAAEEAGEKALAIELENKSEVENPDDASEDTVKETKKKSKKV